MAAIPGGVRVQGFIAPTSSNDTYPVTDPHYGLGGLRTVLNLGQRDLIPAERRIVGMLVFVQSANKYYKLLDDLVQWEEVDLTNILTAESDPTVPLHVKRIPAGTEAGQVLRWNGTDWVLTTLPNETDPTVPTHVKQIPQGSTNGQFLRWNGTQWTAADGSQLPAGTQAGQVLQWNGTTWIAATAPSGGITTETDPTVPTHVKQIPQGSTNGQFLRWNGTQWTAADGSQLPAGTQAGQVLQWNGTTWEAATLPTPPSGGITTETDPTVPTHVKSIPQGSNSATLSPSLHQYLVWNRHLQRYDISVSAAIPDFQGYGGRIMLVRQYIGGISQIEYTHLTQIVASDTLFISPIPPFPNHTDPTLRINLPLTGVTAGVYNNPTSITVDEYGRITNIDGTLGGGTVPNYYIDTFLGGYNFVLFNIMPDEPLPLGKGLEIQATALMDLQFDFFDEPFFIELVNDSFSHQLSIAQFNTAPSLNEISAVIYIERRAPDMLTIYGTLIDGLYSTIYSSTETVLIPINDGLNTFGSVSHFGIYLNTANSGTFSIYDLVNITVSSYDLF